MLRREQQMKIEHPNNSPRVPVEFSSVGDGRPGETAAQTAGAAAFPQPHRINVYRGLTDPDIEHECKLVGICGDLFKSGVLDLANKYRAAVLAIAANHDQHTSSNRHRVRESSFVCGLLDVVEDFERQLDMLTHDVQVDLRQALED